MQRKHVTLQILWDEYIAAPPDGYRYSRFSDLYRGWAMKAAGHVTSFSWCSIVSGLPIPRAAKPRRRNVVLWRRIAPQHVGRFQYCARKATTILRGSP